MNEASKKQRFHHKHVVVIGGSRGLDFWERDGGHIVGFVSKGGPCKAGTHVQQFCEKALVVTRAEDDYFEKE